MTGYSQVKLPIDEVFQEITGEMKEFPKYTTQLINVASQNAQATRPAVVGQMSELINQVPKKSYDAWKEWYLSQYPHAIQRATDKIKPMIDNFRKALELIDEEMIYAWVEDLVLTKTAEGLIIQEKVLQFVANAKEEEWRVATAAEESQNIDGFIGERPVQVKPESYTSKKSSVRETIRKDIEIIYYKRTTKYLTIYLPSGNQNLFEK